MPATRGQVLLRRMRIAVAAMSVLVLALTGTAWGLYRDVTAGIVTTDLLLSGGGGDQNILLVGVDSRTDAQGNPLPPEVLEALNSGADTGVLNSDTIMLLHVPADGTAAVAFSIPRDSYVDIPGYRRDKINAAYPAVAALHREDLVEQGVSDQAVLHSESMRAGRQALIDAVTLLTGQEIDHYAEVNLVGFYDLTTAIGGVDVCLTEAVSEPLSGADFPAGPQTISGGDALAFVRQRHGLPEGDLSRIRRQQVFLAAVADRVLSAGTLTDTGALSGLIEVVQRSVVLDEGFDLLAFAQQAAGIAAGNLQFLTIPNEGLDRNERGDVVLVDPGHVREFIESNVRTQEELAEQAAQAQEAADEARDALPDLPADLVAERYIVHVGNGGAADGVAGTVAEHVWGLGFTRGAVGNLDPVDRSVVRYTDPDADAARALADQLGGLAVEYDESVNRGHLQVALGPDFDPSVVPAAAPETTEQATTDPATPTTEAITAAGVPCID